MGKRNKSVIILWLGLTSRLLKDEPFKLSYPDMRPSICLNDGTVISVQASSHHYSTPREKYLIRYSTVEIYYDGLSPIVEKLERYRDSEDIFGYVPVEIIDELVEYHGGINYSNMISDIKTPIQAYYRRRKIDKILKDKSDEK